jgi:hypothetical protein
LLKTAALVLMRQLRCLTHQRHSVELLRLATVDNS